jgi:hypothetical protein
MKTVNELIKEIDSNLIAVLQKANTPNQIKDLIKDCRTLLNELPKSIDNKAAAEFIAAEELKHIEQAGNKCWLLSDNVTIVVKSTNLSKKEYTYIYEPVTRLWYTTNAPKRKYACRDAIQLVNHYINAGWATDRPSK